MTVTKKHIFNVVFINVINKVIVSIVTNALKFCLIGSVFMINDDENDRLFIWFWKIQNN